MNSKVNSAVKYIGSAMCVGGGMMLGGAALSSGNDIKKKAKKTAGKAIRVLDSALTDLQNMMK